MSVARKVATAARWALLGKTNLPQQCALGIEDPQSEVSVWLYGMGAPRDVTFAHSIACAAPFTICIGGEDWPVEGDKGKQLALRFQEQGGETRILAEFVLRYTASIRTDGPALHVFEVKRCRNFCLPKGRLWAHYLHQAYLRRQSSPRMRISSRAAHAMIAAFICPRPVVLVSAVFGARGNVFPMNLLGSVSKGYFAFALDSTKLAAPLVACARRVALSTVPLEQAEAARQLGKNHKKEFIQWNELPFATRPSTAFGIQVPSFALRVIELQIETIRNLGSHTLFVARIIRDERRGAGQQFCVIHGVYQSWRLKKRPEPDQCQPTITHSGQDLVHNPTHSLPSLR